MIAYQIWLKKELVDGKAVRGKTKQTHIVTKEVENEEVLEISL